MIENQRIIERIKQIVDCNPKKVAVICEDESITFEEFYDRVDKYCARICKNGKRIVFIENKRCIDTIVKIYACVKAECRYRIVNDMSEVDESCEISNDCDSILYEIKTSGTTGKKKLIQRRTEEFNRFIFENYVERYEITADDVILNQLDFSFDAAAKDIFAMGVSGATLVIGNREKMNYPMEFIKIVDTYKVTVFQTTPFFIKNMAKLKAFEEMVPKGLGKVLFVGDVLKSKYLNYWIERMQETTFINQYGVSEYAGNLMDNIINAPVQSEYVTLKNQIVPISIDENGQLVVMNNLETGDMAKYCGFDNSEICILGRMDNVRKIRGYRVSLEEIEREISSALGKTNVLCEIKDDELYVLCEVSTSFDQCTVNYILKNKLPFYCKPIHIKWVDLLPVNNNGKPDRKRIIEYF